MHISISEQRNSSILLEVKYPSLKYVNEFVRMKCSPDLIKYELFPNVKEISESMTALVAVRKYLGAKSFGDENFTVIDAGCGRMPRTAALFAFLTRWQCYAVDPLLQMNNSNNSIKRLQKINGLIEQQRFDIDGTCIFLAVHSHISLPIALQNVKAKRIIIVAIPCCKPLILKKYKPVKEYEDEGCLSPKRLVRMYDIGM